MYIDPLVEILQDNNRPGSFSWLSSSKGVYNSDPGQTLVLLVDFKSEFEAIWPLLKVALEPLRRHGWLSRVRNGDTFVAPVTIVATGTPALAILDQKGRDNTGDIFIDAPLSRLNCDAYSTTNSYWASASLKETIGFWWFGYLWPGQLTPIKEQVAEAHRRGLKVRYWGLPSWPAVLRNHIWGSLSGAGVDIFNVDDLENAVGVLSPGTRPVR
jgi:hypothetical protein